MACIFEKNTPATTPFAAKTIEAFPSANFTQSFTRLNICQLLSNFFPTISPLNVWHAALVYAAFMPYVVAILPFQGYEEEILFAQDGGMYNAGA